ncbi:MAG: hypothetical protein HUJ70_14680 [Pseudobutyrivibrio sp.]|nr:hypothetical protein [Pseudobutyrivibrio sp.]MCF0186192.1 hypothetical protein [Bacteroidaceae bacterium]
MKNRITVLLTALVCAVGVIASTSTAKADTIKAGDNWKVTFTSDKKMDANFNANSVVDSMKDMQPGDTAVFQVAAVNSFNQDTDWYMTNDILQSMEDKSKTAAGGAYSYYLVYTDPSGANTVLYDSQAVGGESYIKKNEGLHEATDNLKDFFYLDTLKSGEKGLVSLRVTLDGETQGNDYQDTLAKLQINFAVEIPTEGGGQDRIGRTDNIIRTAVRTGDDTNLTVLYIAAIVLGLLCATTGILGVVAKRKEA